MLGREHQADLEREVERSRLADQVADRKSTSWLKQKVHRERKGASVHTVIASSRTRGAVRGEPARLGASLEEGQDLARKV